MKFQVGDCLFYKEWHRPKFAFRDAPEVDQQMLYGLLFSFKNFTEKIAPVPTAKGMRSIRTGKYTMHLMETASGLRFVLNSSNENTDMTQNLEHIFGKLFVQHVAKNPLYKLGDKITSTRFTQALDVYIGSLPAAQDGKV